MMLGAAVVGGSVVAAIVASQSVTAGSAPPDGHLRVTEGRGDGFDPIDAGVDELRRFGANIVFLFLHGIPSHDMPYRNNVHSS